MSGTTVFSRWRKTELIELIEKLNIDETVHYNQKKSDLIDILVNHLSSLETPLDYVNDYPELQTYYTSQQQQEEDVKSILEDTKSILQQNHQHFNLTEINTSIQDALSTILSIDIIFYSLEAYTILKNCSNNLSQTPLLLLLWCLTQLLIPALVAYYINFIRYDLAHMELDPMVFHLVKTLLSIYLSATARETVSVWSSLYSDCLADLPVYFGVSGILLTLYIF